MRQTKRLYVTLAVIHTVTTTPSYQPLCWFGRLMCYLRADVQCASGDTFPHVIKFDNNKVNCNLIFNNQQHTNLLFAIRFLLDLFWACVSCKMNSVMWIFLSPLHFNLIILNQTSARTPTHQYLIKPSLSFRIRFAWMENAAYDKAAFLDYNDPPICQICFALGEWEQCHLVSHLNVLGV